MKKKAKHIKGFSRLYDGKPPAHKMRCATCEYHTTLFESKGKTLCGGSNIICDYIGVVGHMRPCPAAECTVYKQMSGKRPKKARPIVPR